MRKIIVAAWVLMLFSSCLQAAEVFDRTAEVDKYVQLLQTADFDTLEPAAKEIYASGIGDARLAEAINARLLKDLPIFSNTSKLGYGHEKTRRVSQCMRYLVSALISTGHEEYRSTLTAIRNSHSEAAKVAKRAELENRDVDSVSWHRRKNEVMASTKNHHEGDDSNVSRLINLLQTDDYSYKYWAVDRMSWDKVLDPRLMRVIAAQTQEYVDRHGNEAFSMERRLMAYYVKMLGYSKDAQYRGVLENLKGSNFIDARLSKAVNNALTKLN